MTEPQKGYIITEDGMNELDKYFSEHHDGLIHIAWKNLKDKFIRPAKESSDKVLEEKPECFGTIRLIVRKCLDCKFNEVCYDKRQELRTKEREQG